MFLLSLCCGDKRIRTADICRAKAALYQLSYTPIKTLKKRQLYGLKRESKLIFWSKI